VTGDGFQTSYPVSSQVPGDADPGVISEGDSEDDFMVSRTSVLISWCMCACMHAHMHTPSPKLCFRVLQV
jgi:hypothetical protein